MGRPKGSKNKPKGNGQERITAKKTKRIKGEKLSEKINDENTEIVKVDRRGRPKGSKSSYTVSPEALSQRRENGALKFARTDEEREYNARLIEHIIRIQEIASTADRTDLVSLKSCFYNYLRLCQEDGYSIGNLAAYASMGFRSAMDFERFSQKDDPDIKQFVAMIKTTCSMFRETNVSNGKINPVIGIFWQRNFDGLRNDTEQIQAIKESEENDYQSKNYKDKYKNLIG